MKQNKRTLSAALFSLIAGLAHAQDNGLPLSAIDWLSENLPTDVANTAPVSTDLQPQKITVTPLDPPSKDPVGLLPTDVTGLPRTMWSASDEMTLVNLVRQERNETLPAIRAFLTVMMLSQADPPFGAGPDGALFLERVDKLVDLGAIESAKALIEQATPDTRPVFQRWFDVSLLTGTEDDACAMMADNPSVAPTYAARIFCLARNGDWPTAVLTLNTRRVLGDITPEQEALITRFLDPELFENAPPLAPPTQVTPLVFRLHEAIGESLITHNLPLAFAHADLRTTTAWRSQMEAAERLARNNAINANVLQNVYTARTPAASGGIWDRAKAIQMFDQAITAKDPDSVSRTLPAAWNAMKAARTEIPFAKIYGPALAELARTGPVQDIAFTVGLLSPDYENTAINAANSGQDPFLIALARGVPQESRVTTPQELAIQAAFNGAPPPPVLTAMVASGKLGEALLRTIALIDAGYAGDANALTDGLSLFRSVGLEDLARRTALQLLILERSN